MRMHDALFLTPQALLDSAGETNALTDSAALDESGLVSADFDAITSRVSLIFDCRGALEVVKGDVAVVVIDGVTEWTWKWGNAPKRSWHIVSMWEPTFDGSAFSLYVMLGFSQHADLDIIGTSARFIVGRTPLFELAPPDLTSASDEEIRKGFPDWDTPFELKYGSTIG